MGNKAPNKKVLDAAERIRRYDKLIQKQTGIAVKPLRFDGYVNLLNKYGTQKDTTENYQYEAEPAIADEMLSNIYESNGLFARIIDAPAEEAMKSGFELDGIKDTSLIEFYETALDDLDWEETCITAIKWARLFGGSIAVMLIDDGGELEKPLDWKNIQSIDGIRVYDRSVVQADYGSMFSYSPEDPFRTRGNTIGVPEFYYINSKYGTFKVHESRCLVFKNGVLPENCSNSIYEMWGMPEYIRIKRAMRDCELAHGNGPKMLERAIQAVYKVKHLSSLLETEDGEDLVLKRLQTVDLARGLLNSIAIDAEGEEYDFKTFTFAGVSEIIDTTCNQLSALTSIPQTILFGRAPAGMNATGESDMENWYSFVARIQNRMLRRNLRYLLSIIFQAGITTGEIDEVPPIKPKFKPLWSLSELEEAQLEQTRAATQQTRAATAQIYVGMQAVDPTEVRKGLSDSGEFNIETLLDDYSDEELFQPDEENPDIANTTTAEGQIAEQGDFSEYAESGAATNANNSGAISANGMNADYDSSSAPANSYSVGVVVVSDGKILVGTRNSNTGKGELCGPGGHIERWETPEQAALRETKEEFGIVPTDLVLLGYGTYEPDTGLTPILYLCTEYTGKINCTDFEIINPQFLSLEEIKRQNAPLFKPFKDGIDKLLSMLDVKSAFDGGSGSGNFNHEGVPGQLGGSAPSFQKGEITEKMKSERSSVSIARPSENDVKKAFEGASEEAMALYEKYSNEIYEAEEAGDESKANELKKAWNNEQQENQKKRLKSLGTYMDDGFYVAEKDLDDLTSDVFQPQKVNKEAGCLNVRPYNSGNSDDEMPASYLSKSYVKISEDEAKARLVFSANKFGFDQTLGGISKQDERFIKTYTYATPANSALRKGETNEQAEKLKAIFSRTASPERTLFRGIQGDFAAKVASLKVGESITDKGFMSASSDESVAKTFAGDSGIVMKINVPSGLGKSLAVSSYSLKPEEAEVILNAGTSLLVKHKKGNHIECDAVFSETNNDGVKKPLSSKNKSDNCEKPIDKCSESGIVRVEGQQRTDDDDELQFITVNGTHIPLVDGKAVGGPLKGEDFSKSKSESKSGGKARSRKTGGARKAPDSPKRKKSTTESKDNGKAKSGSDNRQNKAAPIKPSPYGENKKTTGFINKAELEDHFTRHGKALGCSSKEEYQEKGTELLTKPCTNGIAGYARSDGKVVRFNTKTGEYVSGYPGQNLCTYMIPKDNNGVDLPRALAYYNKHRQADEARYGSLK